MAGKKKTKIRVNNVGSRNLYEFLRPSPAPGKCNQCSTNNTIFSKNSATYLVLIIGYMEDTKTKHHPSPIITNPHSLQSDRDDIKKLPNSTSHPTTTTTTSLPSHTLPHYHPKEKSGKVRKNNGLLVITAGKDDRAENNREETWLSQVGFPLTQQKVRKKV